MAGRLRKLLSQSCGDEACVWDETAASICKQVFCCTGQAVVAKSTELAAPSYRCAKRLRGSVHGGLTRRSRAQWAAKLRLHVYPRGTARQNPCDDLCVMRGHAFALPRWLCCLLDTPNTCPSCVRGVSVYIPSRTVSSLWSPEGLVPRGY